MLCAAGLVTLFLPRIAAAAKPSASGTSGASRGALMEREQWLQGVVDGVRSRLSIPQPVVASIVPTNKLVVSVQRSKDQPGVFALSVEDGFLAGLSDEEVSAVVAHELGHVWIYTHHPFLQTEELANEVAIRVVGRHVLEDLYKKVWARTGVKGTLAYLPGE
jgi:hypothetical protein